jgi:hypothetical protein
MLKRYGDEAMMEAPSRNLKGTRERWSTAADAGAEFGLILQSQMLKARRAEYDQQRIGASPASDTNSRNDTSCDATTRDDNIGNDYSRSTSSEPPPDVKRARQRTRTLQVCQRSIFIWFTPSH